MNVVYPFLIEPGKVKIPPLHVKLGFVKNEETINKIKPAHRYSKKFPQLSVTQNKTYVFVGRFFVLSSANILPREGILNLYGNI